MTVFTAPEVIGHRGSGRGTVGGARENTAASFDAAVRDGATWIEIDVRRSADDVLLIHHDAALPDGRAIVDLPSAVCRDHGLLTLEEAVAAVPADIGLDVDVKTVMEDATDPPARRTMALLIPFLRREARRRRVFVCSFDPAALVAVHAEAPEVPTAWMPFVRNPLDQAVAGAAGLGCAIVAIDARSFGLSGDAVRPGRREVGYTVDIAHQAGLEVVSWCPDPVDAARFADAGVDAVVVDDVPGVVASLKAR
ncbi:MAG: glycerophosphodiester phosphodiesterase [Nocardiopsaceae bacterium]|nr:glycerophosphodiester phosphodiesterase [Nocardiopsaceae bacterium]